MRITLTPRAEFDRPAYAVPRAPFPIDLRLDGNEGQAPDTALLDAFRQCSSASIRQYPSSLALERAIAARYRIAPEQVLITAGGDDAIQRICRAFLGPTRSIVLPVPTFEMIGRFARWEESEILPVPWESPRYPVNEVLKAVQADTTVIAMVSPNNPTGGWATVDDLREVAQAAPGALVMVDAAYAEFGDVDLTETALELPNTLVLRTFSKAYGLAGLRIGYVMGEARWVRALRAAGLPYPVSQPSIALALRALEGGEGRRDYTDRVAAERPMLAERLRAAGWKVSPSRGILCSRGGDSLWLRDAIAAMGIGIRAWQRMTYWATASDPARVTQLSLRDSIRPCRPSLHPKPSSLTWMGCSQMSRAPIDWRLFKRRSTLVSRSGYPTLMRSRWRGMPITTGS